MASKNTAPLALFLSFNLLMFTVLSDCGSCNQPYPYPPGFTPPAFTPPVIYRPPPTVPYPPSGPTCPINTLQLGVCANVLDGLLGLIIGSPPIEPCCSLIEGLLDLEAAICLCLALNANILGININVQLALQVLLNVCSKEVPPGFICAQQ